MNLLACYAMLRVPGGQLAQPKALRSLRSHQSKPDSGIPAARSRRAPWHVPTVT
jgi:hypothetical protein